MIIEVTMIKKWEGVTLIQSVTLFRIPCGLFEILLEVSNPILIPEAIDSIKVSNPILILEAIVSNPILTLEAISNRFHHWHKTPMVVGVTRHHE